jgi:hypothetical protein
VGRKGNAACGCRVPGGTVLEQLTRPLTGARTCRLLCGLMPRWRSPFSLPPLATPTLGFAVRGIRAGRCIDGAALRRNWPRARHHAQARTHDGRRRDSGEQAGQGLGLYGARAGGARCSPRASIGVSPAYLKACGTPKSPEDLSKHDCITYSPLLSRSSWTFKRDQAEFFVPVRSRLIVSNLKSACDAARAGIGIAEACS